MTSRRSVPSGLHRAGRALWTSITDFYELDPGERSTLEQAARLADSAEGLHAVIDAEGPMVAGSRVSRACIRRWPSCAPPGSIGHREPKRGKAQPAADRV